MMSLDWAQFQHMQKEGPGNNCWIASEQVCMKLLLTRSGAFMCYDSLPNYRRDNVLVGASGSTHGEGRTL